MDALVFRFALGRMETGY